ncbi:MAG: type II secretion system F family protein [Candidatus Eremiobacterota bacterium]
MPLFDFSGLDKDGRRTTGTLEAENKEGAMTVLSNRNLTVTKLIPVKVKKPGAFPFFGTGRIKIKGEELLLFTQELASMLSAGINMRRALDIISADVDTPDLKQIVRELLTGIGEGKSLSELFNKYPDVFSKLYVSMVEAGEASGKLPDILLRLATYIENAENLKKKVQGAFYYPVIVLVLSLFITAFIFIFGIPRIKSIYDQLGGELPIFTRVFIDLSTFISQNLLFIIPLAIILVTGLTYISKTEQFKYFLDNLKLKNKLLGPIFQRLAIARFSRTLSALYTSGVPLLQAMEIVSASMGNVIMEEAVKSSIKKLAEGENLADPLRDTNVFTQMAISMLAAGEEAGTLGTMLDRLADFYETQVEISIRALTDLIEPLIMVFIGVIIGVLILVLALPFMQLSTVLH